MLRSEIFANRFCFTNSNPEMVKHTQTVRRLLATNCLSVFYHFVEWAFKGLTNSYQCSLCFIAFQ